MLKAFRPYLFIYVALLGLTFVYAFFFKSRLLLSLSASLSAIFIFSVSSFIGWYCAHRRDNKKNTVNTIIYDAVYGLILKYMVLVLLLVFYFKFIKIEETLFILEFILLIIIKNIFIFVLYLKSHS